MRKQSKAKQFSIDWIKFPLCKLTNLILLLPVNVGREDAEYKDTGDDEDEAEAVCRLPSTPVHALFRPRLE